MAWGKNANVNKQYIDTFIGNNLAALRQALENLNDFNMYGLTPEGGQTWLTGLGYTSGDASQLAAATGDMVSLYSVYFGNATIASGGAITVSSGTGHNFDLNAKLGAGIAVTS